MNSPVSEARPCTSEDVYRLYNLFLQRDPEHARFVSQRLGKPFNATFSQIVSSEEFYRNVVSVLTSQDVFPDRYMGGESFENLMVWAGGALPIDQASRKRLSLSSSLEEFYLGFLLDTDAIAKHIRLAAPNIRRAIQLRRLENQNDPRRLSLAGIIDYVNTFEIRGWCVNKADPPERMSVEIFADNLFLGLCHCSEFRSDLQERFGGDGNYGFTFMLSPSQLDAFQVDRWINAREVKTRRVLGRFLAPSIAPAKTRGELDRLTQELAEIREALDRFERALPRLPGASGYPLSAYGGYFSAYYQPAEDSPRPLSAAASKRGPLISLVIPLVEPDLELVHDAVSSVLGQTYREWELLVVNTVPEYGEPSNFLKRASRDDRRIRVIVDKAGEGDFVRAANLGLTRASGQFIGVLRSGDRLAPDALRYMVATAPDGDADLIYADGDAFDPAVEGGPVHHTPQLRPDFDVDLLLAHNYIGDFFLTSSTALRAVGPLSDQFPGVGFHDLALRVVERAAAGAVRHAPKVLHHRRAATESGTAGEDKSTEVVACVNAYLARNDLAAIAEAHEDPMGRPRPMSTRLRWKLPEPAPSVSIIIPTRDHRELLEPCLASLVAATRDYPGLAEVIVVDNDTIEPDAVAYLSALATSGRARILRFGGAFNWSAINNFAVGETRGEVLIFLNNDTLAMADGWCSELCSLAARPDVGAVGTRLLYADATIQHAGVAVGVAGGLAAHEGVGETVTDGGYMGRSHLQRGVSAVTAACMATRRQVFEQVGGFDELALKVAFNDTDYCLKARAAGLKVIYTPFATMYHFESKSRGIAKAGPAGERERREAETFRLRWGRTADPFGNPHFEPYAKPLTVLRPPPTLADLEPGSVTFNAEASSADATAGRFETRTTQTRSDPLSNEAYEAAVQTHRRLARHQLAEIDVSGADGVDPETIRTIVESGLFDADYYLHENPDVEQTGTDPLIHYIRLGETWDYEYRPNPTFFPGVYRRLNMPGAPPSACALEHYIREGEQAGLKASLAFDPGAYLRANSPLTDFVDRPLFHYLKIGRPAGLKIRPANDAEPRRRKAGPSRPRIAAYLGVKDEVEIIERSIAHLRSIGVDYIMACDMSSTDGTAELLEKYRADDFSILTLTNAAIDDTTPEEESWKGHCIRRCAEAPADWVIFLDADEFWLPVSGNLKDCECLQIADAVSVDRFNIVLGPGGPMAPSDLSPSGYDRMLLFAGSIGQFELQNKIAADLPWIFGGGPPKILAKISMMEGVTAGAHDVWGPAMHRRTAQDVVIAHLALSTRSRFERKVRNLRAMYQAAGVDLSAPENTWREFGTAWHWRRWASAENLDAEFDHNVTSPERISGLRAEGIIRSARDVLDADRRKALAR